jgi:hypothetical protein
MSYQQSAVLRQPEALSSNQAPIRLLSTYRLGEFELTNRVVMSPMTRSRAVEGNVPNPLAATYYAQRASAGLIVTEGTQVSPQGVGYIRTPGIHSPEQMAGWRQVTDAVHRAGGKIFAQLWHVGRISHPDFHGGELPVAPSAIAADGEVFTNRGRTKMVTPRALDVHELPGIVEQFQRVPRTQRLPASTASSCMAPTAISWINSCAMAPTGAPMLMAAASATGPASRSRSPRPLWECGVQIGSATRSRQTAVSIRCRIPIRPLPIRTSPTS